MADEYIYDLDPDANTRGDGETGADYVWEFDGAFFHTVVSCFVLLVNQPVGFSLIFVWG